MKTVIIACSMLRDELEQSLTEQGASTPVVWMEKGLHDKPEYLHRELQTEINAHQDWDVIVLAYCLCGNAVLGVVSQTARLVIPKFDDCIRMLRSVTPGSAPEVDCRCLYFTRGWIDSDKFLLDEMRRYAERYGDKKGARILESMLGNYTGVRLVDTGAYDTARYSTALCQTAEDFGLNFDIVPGTRRVLEKLAAGSFDEDFCIIEPGRPVTPDDFKDRAL